MSLMGIDVGTTGCKALVVSYEGTVHTFSYREYPLLHPRPGWAELDPALVWASIEQVIGEAASGSLHDPIRAVGVSVQGEATVPVSRNGSHLNNFVVTFDERTAEQCAWWERSTGSSKLFKITGMPLHPMYSINKIMWFARHMPELCERTWKFLCMEDYVLMKLGVEPAIDHSLAARTMAFDLMKRDWSDFVLKRAGVERGSLARLQPSGSVAGTMPPNIAQALGLPRGVAAVTGGHDQCCGALGSGVLEEGMAMNATGTSDVLQPVFTEPRLGKAMLDNNYCCYPHVKEDMHTCCAFNLTGGLLLRWYRDTFWQPEMKEAARLGLDVYDLIIDGASPKAPPLYILPHFVGSGTPSLDPRSSGVMLGLTLATTRGEVSGALLDSLNYELRLNIETLEEIGIPIGEIRAVGGGAKSNRWLQMKADVFGKPVTSLSVSEAACLGAALLAGAAVGIYSSVDEAARAAVMVGKTYEPRPEEHERHTERFDVYRRIYPSLRPIIHGFRG
jgi:xylulokinase